MTHETNQQEQWQQELARLDIDDVLGLCYAFGNQPKRLEKYLQVLRQRGGERAQFASALLCFDLARQGSAAAQREFVLLSPTLRALSRKVELVAGLVQSDAYLTFLWDLCEAALESDADDDGGPASAALDFTNAQTFTEVAGAGASPVASINLLGDDDFDDGQFAFTDDHDAPAALIDAVDEYLGAMPGLPMYHPRAGFRARNRRDIERLEKFLQKLEGLSGEVPLARAYHAMALLFSGTCMRSRNMFGLVNRRKQEVLREGVRALLACGVEAHWVAAVFDGEHSDADAWPRIAQVLLEAIRDPQHLV